MSTKMKSTKKARKPKTSKGINGGARKAHLSTIEKYLISGRKPRAIRRAGDKKVSESQKAA